MPRIDNEFVKKIYSEYGQDLTPEKLEYINNTYASDDEFKKEFLYKYGSKEQEPVEGKKKTQEPKSNSTANTKASGSRTPKVNGKPISGGEKPKKTSELASSSGTTWNKQPETLFTTAEKIVREEDKKKKATTTPKVDKKPMPVFKGGLDLSQKTDAQKATESFTEKPVMKSVEKLIKDNKYVSNTGINEDIEYKQSLGELPPTSQLIQSGAVNLDIYGSNTFGLVNTDFNSKDAFKPSLELVDPFAINKVSKKNTINYDNLIKSKDLNLTNPYLYYSKSKLGDNQVSSLYGELPVIDLNDFDGFLNKSGYLGDLNKEIEEGLYLDNRGSLSENYDAKLLKEKKLVDYLGFYIHDKNQRDYDRRVILYKKENPNATEEDISNNVTMYTFVSEEELNNYINKNFPTYSEAIEKRKEKEKQEYDETVKNKGSFFSWQTPKKILKGASATIQDRIQNLSSTIYDLIGLDNMASQTRLSSEENSFNRPESRDISYVSGKKVSLNGKNYLIDSDGQVYDYDIKKRVTDLLSDKDYKSIVSNSNKAEDDNMFSWTGATVQTTNAVADLALQIAITRGSGTGMSMLGSGLTKEGLALLSKIPVSPAMASSAAAQSFLGYSEGLEGTYKAAKDAGIIDSEAKLIADDAATKMATLYLLTSGISPQTKATFTAEKNKLIQDAVKIYATKGKPAYIKFINNGIKKLKDFVVEGGKETGQELIQLAGEVGLVNPTINEAAGKDIVQSEITADQVISMIPSTFIAGGLPVMIKMKGFFSKKDYLSNLDLASVNVDLSNNKLKELLDKKVINKDEYDEATNDLKIYSQNKNKVPKDTPTEIALDVMKKINEVSDLEESKKTIDKSFHEDIDKKIDEKRNEIKELYNKKEDATVEVNNNEKNIVENQPSQEVSDLRNEEQQELIEAIPNAENYFTDGKVDKSKLNNPEDIAKFEEIYNKYDELISPILDTKVTDEKVNSYVQELDSTKKSDPETYWSVSEVSNEDAAQGTIIDTEDGSAMVKANGDIVGVFKKIGSKAKGVAQDLLNRAVAAGGTKLRNFDGYLTKQYEKAGFRVVSRTPFNEEYAPEGWNKDKHGTPDVVAMVYDPKGELNIEEKTFDNLDTGYDEMIAYRDKLISDQTPKFQKSKIEVDGSTVDLITEEMNSMPEEIAKFDIPSNLTTKEKTNVGSLTERFNDKVKTIKDVSELDGVPFIFTISDQLTSGEIKNPFTGNTIDVKGGIGFNMTEGNEGNAWANTTEAEANNMLQRATDVYSKNKDLFDRLWSEGKIPNGHVPMAVIKMGQTSIKSNEALFRFASDTFKKRFSKAKRIAAKNGLLKDLKSAKDIDQDVIDFVEKQNTIDEVLDNIKELGISKRPNITRFVFTGDVKLGAKTSPGKPKSNTGSSLVGENKDDYKYVHLQTINNLISEPATASIPDSHIVSVVGVDVLNPSVTKVDHQNYPFGVKGQLIGVLESPIHAADVFPEMYSKSIYLQKENKAGVPTSPETAVRQSVAAGGAVAGIKAFRGAKIATKMTELQKLLGKLKLAFPSVTVVDTQEEFLNELEKPNVKRFVKDGDVVYGFTKDGKVFLNPEKANSNTAIHEYSHIWTGFLKENNPSLLKKGYDLLEGTSILNNKIAEFGDNELARDEAMAELIANKGETIIEAGIKSKFKNWLNAVFNYIKANFKSFDKMSATELQNINLNQFVDGALSSLLGGKEVTSKETKGIGVKFSKEGGKKKISDQIKKVVGIKPKATEQKRINKAFAIGVATQKVETKAQKDKTKIVKEELSDIKKQLSDLFSSAKESLKITKDRASEISKLKKGAESFVNSAINGLSAGDIGNRAIKSIVSKINDITDVNFDEKLNEINDTLTNLYSKKDVNEAKANRKKAVKNVLSGKVGKLSKDGDRKEVLNSKVLNFALLNPSILKKVLDDASFGVYTDAIKALSEKKGAISDTDIEYYKKIYDEVSDKHNKFQDNVNKIQEKINVGDALSVDEQKFFDKNQDEFYENESQEDIEEKEEAKRVKKEADIKKKKDGIRAFIPFLNDVFLKSEAKKDSLEYRILSVISTLNESDINEMSSAMLTNTLNTLNSLVNDDVLVAYADKLHQHIIANNTKRIALESVGRAGKGGLYSNKVSRAFLKVRDIINSPIASLIGIGKGKLDLALLKSRTDFMRMSSIDAALKIYRDSPIYDNIISTLGKAMSYVSDTQSKAEEMLSTAKELLDKNSDNVNESYMKITYFLIDKMSKANQGTTSEVSAMKYFESTLNDPKSRIKDNQNHVDALSEFIDKVKKNNGVVELTIDEARAANVIRIVLDENKMDAYEALVFQNENASPMVNEYFPLLNNLKDQTSNDLDKLSARFKTTSTKSSNLEEKTGKEHPIDMNPFSSAFQSVKNTSIQFNLRSEFIGIMRGLNNAIEENNKKQDSKEKRDADMYLSVINDSIQRNMDLIVNGSIYQSSNLSDGFWNYFDKIAYHAMLGSTVSRGVDFAGNLVLLGTLDPKLLVMGNKVFDELSKIKSEAESYTDILRKFLKNAEASNITKLISTKKVGNERTEFLNKSGNQNIFKRGLVSSNKATKISANIKSSKPVETIQGINDVIINFSDVKPYGIAWMSMFRDNFIKETGNELDVEKITRGDLGYLKENKKAIKNASNKANLEAADMFGSNNPFEKQIGILEAVSGKKDSKNILSSAFNRTKFFLSGFNIGALSSITTAVNKFAETKDSRELRKAIGGSVRMLSYAPAVSLITGSIWALLRGEDDDDEKMRGLLNDIRDDKDFLKSINEFLNYPVQEDEDGNPIEIKGDDLIKLEELKDNLLKDKRFKDAYDIYYGYVTREIFEDDVRGETASINESGLNVDKSTIDVPMSKIRGGKYGLKDKEVVELLATIHSEKGRMLFDSEEDRADVISEIEDYLVKTQFFNKQVMIENFKYIDNQIVRNLSTIVSDYRNNSIEDDLVKEGLSFVSDLFLSKSNNMLKGGYNYLAEMGNKYKIQSEQGDIGYSYYKDQVFNPLFSYGLNKEFDEVQKKDIVFDALKVLNPTLGSSLSNDNFDLKTTSLMRLLRTTGTFGFNDFAKIKTRAENDVIYNSLRGKFTKNIVKDFSDAKLFMTKEEKEKKMNEDMQYRSPIIQSKDRTYKVNGKSAN